MTKKLLKERFQKLAGIITEQNFSNSTCDEIIYLAECGTNCLGAGNPGLVPFLYWYPYSIQQILNYLETGTILNPGQYELATSGPYTQCFGSTFCYDPANPSCYMNYSEYTFGILDTKLPNIIGSVTINNGVVSGDFSTSNNYNWSSNTDFIPTPAVLSFYNNDLTNDGQGNESCLGGGDVGPPIDSVTNPAMFPFPDYNLSSNQVMNLLNQCYNPDPCYNVPEACCPKCQSEGGTLPPEDPCHSYCECCNELPLRYKCALGGQCISSTNPNFPFDSLDDCLLNSDCGQQEESDCNLFNSQPQQEQDLVCAACGNGGSFEAEFLGTTITITLPPIVIDLCNCCPQGIPPIPNIDPNKAKMIISKIEKLLKGKPNRLKTLAGIKPKK